MMAKMHSVQLENKEVLLLDRVENFISCCNPVSDKVVKEGMTKDMMRVELNMLIGLLENCSSPLVFWHNDALLANIVLKKTEEVIFIDMEYG